MSSPFSLFRKHQKVMLVVLVGLSMLSFVIFDAVQNVGDISQMPPTLVMLAMAALAGSVAWVFGIGNAKSSEYGSIGLLVGLAIGLVFVLQTRKNDSVTTGAFAVSQNEMQELLNSRFLANRFVVLAVRKTSPDPESLEAEQTIRANQFTFGFPEERMDEDVLLGELLRREADKVNLQLPDAAVHDFIKELTNLRMTKEDFRDIRHELRASEGDVINSLKRELRAREAANLLYSPIDLPPAIDWEFSQQMQVRQSATTAAIPVSAFLDEQAEPTASELEALFQEYRSNGPGVTPTGKPQEGRPGFFQPPRIKLAYITPDYQAFEQQVEQSEGVTDAEIEARYQSDYVEAAQRPTIGEENLLFDDGPQIPGLSLPGFSIPGAGGPSLTPPVLPETTPPATPDEASETTPATPDAPASEAPATETPATPPAGEAAAPETPAATPPATEQPASETPATPAPDAPATETPATPAPEAQPETEAKPEGSSCDDPPAAETPAADAPATDAPAAETPVTETPATEAPAKETPAGETPAAETPAPSVETPAATPPAGEAPATDAPAATPPAGETPPAAQPANEADPFPIIPGTTETPPPTPSTAIPPLDDALKADIREQILAEKTAAAIETAMSAAMERIRNEIGRDVHAPEGTPQRLTHAAATKLVQEYAAANHFTYVETDSMSYQELLKSDDYPVAQFRRPMPQSRFQTYSVADELFSSSKKDIFRPRRIDDRDAGGQVRDRAIYWKLDHEPGYIPENMSSERVRNQVVQTWRELQARQKAEQRAQEIAEQVRKSDQPMLEKLADVTITGQANSTLLNIMQTGQFTWIRQTIVPAMTLRGFDFAPVRSQIPGLEPLGDDFMRVVFRELRPGDVGVAPSADRSVFYVVKIDTRIPANDEEWDIVRNNFLSGNEDMMLDRLGGQYLSSEIPHWADQLFRSYDVRLAERD